MKINKKLETVTILRVKLDKDNFPILYDWAKSNPETLAKQLQSNSLHVARRKSEYGRDMLRI